jgi:hypothetical protein
MNKFAERSMQIVSDEGFLGLSRRIFNRLIHRPVFINLYIFELEYKKMVDVPSPAQDIEVSKLKGSDKDFITTLASFGFYGRSAEEIGRYLAEGQDCYVAIHKNQVISCYWRMAGYYYDHFLRRGLILGDDEEYIYGAFTAKEFRGLNIYPLLLSKSSGARSSENPNMRAFSFIRTNNQSSQHSFTKLGFMKVGRIGFIDILGLRLNYLLGKRALPYTQKRTFINVIF